MADYFNSYHWQWLPLKTTESEWIISNVAANIAGSQDTWATVKVSLSGLHSLIDPVLCNCSDS